MACSAPGATQENANTVQKKLRILSANLWNGRVDPDGFVNLVESLAADVVAVQELSFDQAEALSACMPHGVLYPASNFVGMGIALRRPASLRKIPLVYRDAHVAALHPAQWPGLGSPLEIVNVHIMAPHIVWPRPGMLGRPPQVRGLMRALTEEPAPQQRVVVGDFNSTPLWPTYRRMAAQFTDAAVAVAKATGSRPLRTWGPTPSAPRLLRIDHAFSSGVEVEGFAVRPLPGGDHCAIVVDISMSAGRTSRSTA